MPALNPFSTCPDLSIDWTHLSLAMWRGLFARAHHAPLTQGYDYARAIAATSAFRPRWGVIQVGGAAVGLVQVLTAALPGRVVEYVSLERGPVWFAPVPDPAWVEGFFASFARAYPARFLRRRRLLPEIKADIWSSSEWAGLGFRPHPHLHPYQTVWVDGGAEEESLRAQLDKKWRNLLSKAERAPDLVITHSTKLSDARPLVQAIVTDQKMRGYRGPDARLLATLARTHAEGDGILASVATVAGELVAGALFLRHGRCATWQAGVVLPQGRENCANYRVVFEGLATLYRTGVASVDLGGYNTTEAAGIRHFKQGLGGEDVQLVGAFI